MTKFLINSSLKGISNIRYFATINGQLLSRPVTVSMLNNGIRVASQETNSPLACTSLFVKTGSRCEDTCNNGITHFIEHMAYQGFNNMSKNNLQEYVSGCGVKLSALTAREYQVFTAISSAEHAPECLNILINILINLQLSESDIELQKECVNSEALDNDNNTKSVLFDYLNQTAYQGTLLGQSVIGPNKTRMSFNRDMICNYMANNYLPHRILFVSSGCISHSKNMCKINQLVGNLSPCFCESGAEYEPKRYTGSTIIYRDDSMPYAHIAVAVEAPGYDSPDYLPLFVASCLTGSWDRTQGGTDRHASPLARAAATSKLCEKFDSFYIGYQDTGLWGIYVVANKMELDDMILNIQDQWMQMCTTVTQNDVERAINLAKLKLAKNRLGVFRACNDIGLQLLYSCNWKTLAELFDDMKNISCKEIKNLGNEYIYDKCPVLAAVGPTENIPEYNRLRAGMYWLRL